MNALTKIATITMLIADIGDCDEIQFVLDDMITNLTDLKTALNKPKKVVMKYQLDADGNRVGEGVPVLNTFEPHGDHIKRSSLNLENGVWSEEVENKLTPPETEVEEDSDEEEEDDLVPCKCNTRMDIRGRCDPICSAKQFSKCPAKVDTAYFHITNDYDNWEVKRRDCRSRGDEQTLLRKVASAEPYFLEGEELDDLIVLKEEDEENDGEFNCICCDNFVSYAEEQDEARMEDDKLVCGDCSAYHYCEECDCFYDDEEDLVNVGDKLFCESCATEKKCEDLTEEIQEYISEMVDNEGKLDMLKKIKEIIAEYRK